LSLSGPTILEVVGKVERSNLALIDDGATVIDGGAEMVTDGGRDTAGTLRTEIKCLACGNRAEELEEHHLHMARASHRDKGETWVRPSS